MCQRLSATECAKLLEEQFDATQVIPFGSVRDPQAWHENSDIDLAVSGLAPNQFFAAWAALQAQLPSSVKIDLVDLNNIQLEMYDRIVAEEAMDNNSLDEFQALIDDEIAALRRLVDETEKGLGQIDEFPPSHFEMNALASYVHQFYTGCERILERVARKIDGDVVTGPYSHAELLNQMRQAVYGVRPYLLDETLKLQLQTLLQFRHFFHHAYGYVLEWPKLEPLVSDMSPLLDDFEQRLFVFFMEVRNY